jgi:uncharacterized protein
MNSRRTFSVVFLFLLFIGTRGAFAFDIPPRPNPPRLVNDYANVLSSSENQALERKLVDYSDSTSNQVTIVLIRSLGGDDIVQTAYKIGDAWGVGGKKQDNGVVILAAIDDHEVTIQTGKGMEGPIPDVIAKRIIDNIIVPNFRNNNYYQGLSQASNAIIKLAAGEFVDELGDQQQSPRMSTLLAIIIIIIIIMIISRRNRGGGRGYMGRRGVFFPPVFWGGGGGFGGGGFGGGGGGGFGGFGGGSFGGGGASGRW